MQLVFAPNSDELAATLQMLVQGALQQWLGDRIARRRRQRRAATTRRCRSTVRYTVLLTQDSRRRREFTRAV